MSQHFAVSLHEAALVTPTRPVSTYFAPSDDNRRVLTFVTHSRITESSRGRLQAVHKASRYKQISSRTISGPVCQPGSPTCHQWSDSCCVMLQPCDLQVCLPLTGSLLHTVAGQQQAVFTSAKFVPAGQKYGDDAVAWVMTTHGPQLKTGQQVSDGCEVSPAGRCLRGWIR